MLRSLIVLACMATLTMQTFAQETQSIPVFRPQSEVGFHDWEMLQRHVVSRKLSLLTDSEPTQRRSCRMESVTVDALTCKGGLFSSSRVYKRGEVIALLEPPVHPDRGGLAVCMSVFLALGAGTVVGALFLASVTIIGAVPVAVIGGLLMFVSPMCAMGENNDTPESIYYLRQNTELPVKLKY